MGLTGDPSPISRDRPHCSPATSDASAQSSGAITDLSGSASLQHAGKCGHDAADVRPSPISRDRPHCSRISCAPSTGCLSHHRSLGIGLIAAAASHRPGCSPGPITDLSGSASLQHRHQQGGGPGPAAITDLSGSASLQLNAGAGELTYLIPSPTSRDRPHCSISTRTIS